MLKFCNNPPITPHSENRLSVFSPAVGDASWAAAYTKPRQEKALAAELLQLEVNYFLPMVERVTMSGGRRRRGMHPLFPSYLFYRDDQPSRLAVQRTNRTVQLITPPGAEQKRFQRELRALEQALLSCPDKIELHPRVVDGARVRIHSGAMKGSEGVVVQSANRAKIWLQITALGTGAIVEVPADLLESLD